MQYEIKGTTMQTLEIVMEQGESVYTESGGMAWMTGNIAMDTNTKGGLMKGLARSLAGESLFLTTYSCNGQKALITFTPEAPGSVLPLELGPNQSMICQKDAFMVAQDSVKLELHFRKKLGAGLFGGEGFILQKLTGPGMAWVEIAGEVRSYELSAGQTMKVDPGHIAMYEPSVSYDITRVKGIKNMFFGGEGIFLASLTGPGRIWLQSLPLSNLANKLARYMPVQKSS
ncbi:MAG: TIGR00266 family protein [Ardenticatenaceae bacterium]|nr:TIGR00266 family protein [Ardenticatenaceae bacterium]